jgi:tetratricopeptide (TPR) repeat protein
MEGIVEIKLKTISKDGIAEAVSKAELYRSLNDPEGAESICHDILAVEPDHQLALRLLGLAITDQFEGHSSTRYAEAQHIFESLTDPYERAYYTGLFHERRAKAQMRAGRTAQALVGSFHEAMRCFEEAEKIHPPSNDDAVLRWNRCARLLQQLEQRVEEHRETTFHDDDTAPIEVMQRPRGRAAG